MPLDTLPDSRLADRDFGTVMMDWPLPDGTTVRIECSPIYCANCGELQGHCPRWSTTWACYLCLPCLELHGAIAGTLAVPDQEFMDAVAYEMQARFGRQLTADELVVACEQGQLGSALEKLARESPYR